jgi:branched-chain amino acid transport system permease protein
MIGIYIILTQSLNLVMGYTGLLSLCQAAFYGISAYTVTLLMIHYQLNFFVALILAIVISSALSLIVAIPSLKFKGDYFVLATLGFQAIIFSILYNWVSFTRGPYGIPGIPSPSIFGFTFDEPYKFLVLSSLFALIIIYFVKLITESQFGRILKAIRENEIATKVLGKDTFQFKVKAFALSAGISAIAGGLYATYVTYIDPTSFTIAESLFLVVILAIGGSGNVIGPIVGSVVLIILPEVLRFLQIPDTIAPNIRVMIYALTLIILMRIKTTGLAGEYGFE